MALQAIYTPAPTTPDAFFGTILVMFHGASRETRGVTSAWVTIFLVAQ
jgi:hypothetical protein